MNQIEIERIVARSFANPSCMGGWCTRREACALYAAPNRGFAVERVCAHGEEKPRPIDEESPT
jgi:hypothetical protein